MKRFFQSGQGAPDVCRPYAQSGFAGRRIIVAGFGNEHFHLIDSAVNDVVTALRRIKNLISVGCAVPAAVGVRLKNFGETVEQVAAVPVDFGVVAACAGVSLFENKGNGGVERQIVLRIGVVGCFIRGFCAESKFCFVLPEESSVKGYGAEGKAFAVLPSDGLRRHVGRVVGCFFNRQNAVGAFGQSVVLRRGFVEVDVVAITFGNNRRGFFVSGFVPYSQASLVVGEFEAFGRETEIRDRIAVGYRGRRVDGDDKRGFFHRHGIRGHGGGVVFGIERSVYLEGACGRSGEIIGRIGHHADVRFFVARFEAGSNDEVEGRGFAVNDCRRTGYGGRQISLQNRENAFYDYEFVVVVFCRFRAYFKGFARIRACIVCGVIGRDGNFVVAVERSVFKTAYRGVEIVAVNDGLTVHRHGNFAFFNRKRAVLNGEVIVSVICYANRDYAGSAGSHTRGIVRGKCNFNAVRAVEAGFDAGQVRLVVAVFDGFVFRFHGSFPWHANHF